jgi:nucleotide-binding universal stress UspA family protein
MFKVVLYPIDGSRESQQAAQTVATLVKLHQSRLVILSVVETPQEGGSAAGTASADAIANLLQSAKNGFAQQSIPAETVEREGKPAFTICDVADEISADLIVMGCRGLGLTEEGSSDSITNRVINLSPCPVLIVP